MASATAAAAGSSSYSLPVLNGAEPTDEDSRVAWNKAPCRFCGTGCHVQVGVSNGKVVAVAGGKNAGGNKGRLGVKG